MAWRETRAGYRHFVALLACISLGVAALVGVGSFATSLDRTLGREARTLLGGDLDLRATRPLDPGADQGLERLQHEGALVTRVREMVGMSRRADGRTQLVELKAVGEGYPLYGRVETTPPRPLGALLRDRGAVVEASLLSRLGLHVGDPLTIGDATLTIRGVLLREPDRAAGFVHLGPRVLIGALALDQTGLIQVGSRVRYRTLVRLPPSTPPHTARDALARALADPTMRVVSFDEAQPGLRRVFAQLTTYLGLVGLVSLLVGGIGVASAVSTFIRRRRPTIAILKCLGAGSPALLATYLVQTQALGLAGSLAGAGLGVAVQPLLARLVADMLPFGIEAGLDLWTVTRGVLMGVLATLLCGLWPLLEIRTVPPSLILRQEVEARPRSARRPWLAALPIAGGLALLAFWQAGSFRVGAIFLAAAVTALAALGLIARLLARLARAAPPLLGFAWRHGLAGLHRPGGHATGVIVALGVGVMLLVAVALLEASLGRQVDHERRRETPSFFFVDIQPDQRDTFLRIVSGVTGGRPPDTTPIVRSRLAAINGVPVTREMIDERRDRGDERTWYLTRDYLLTWAAEAPATNVVSRGRWWTPAEAAVRPRVSVEEDAARYLGVSVGDTLAFDIQGVRVEGEVMSLRKVDWQTLSTNFFVVFSQGALDGAPRTYVATARVPGSAEPGLQDAVVTALPNVTAIPVRDVLEQVAEVLDRIAFAIRAIALFSIGAGLSVMGGTLAASRYQRLYESVILRTLGATRGAVARTFAVEYACLGAAAGLGGTLLALALSWIVLRFVLETPWSFEPVPLALGVMLATSVSLAVGFGATFTLLGQKPLSVLRRE